MEEIWKTIKGIGGKYSVSNLGNVKRNEHQTIVKPTNSVVSYKERLLKPYVDSTGYSVVSLQIAEGLTVRKKIHRLVAEAFVDNPHNYPIVNHKDEDKTNNCVDNLEWCDSKYNANYGNRNKKISNRNSIRVAQYTMDGKLIKIWDSMSQAAASFGAKTTTYIRRVCTNQFGRHSYKGYVWKYVDQKVIGDETLKQQMMNDKQLLTEIIMKTFSKAELQSIVDSYNKTAGEK